MSKLDQHVGLVRSKLAFTTFVRGLAWAFTALGAAVLIAIILDRFFRLTLPREWMWLWAGVGAATLEAAIYAFIRRPSAHFAAIEIDSRLGLMEKFSTALFVRSSRDAFAAAAVRDAEATANSVNLHQKFPIAYPKAANVTFAVAIVAMCAGKWLPSVDLFGAEEKKAKIEQHQQAQRTSAERAVRQALAEIDSAPKQVAEAEEIKMARQELTKLTEHSIADPPKATQKAKDALDEIAAIKEKIKDANKYATVQQEMANLKNVAPPSPDETGLVADAQRAVAAQNLDAAMDDLKKAVDKFGQMDKKEQEKTAEQMQKLAEQIAKQANDPEARKKTEDMLKQAGMSQQQAQNMAQKMQQAANGDQQAAQQLQQMANQAIQQSNQQSGQSQAQQKAVAQAIQKAVQQGQQQANGQASAQQMAAASKALANAMKQAAGQGQKSQQAQAGQGQNGQQGQGKSQAGQGQSAQGQPRGQGQGQKGQQAQASGQGQGGQGNQGVQGGQTAQQQMQQQLSQLQAMVKDSQGIAAGQQGQGPGVGQGQNQQANGQWGQGNQENQQGNPQQGQGGNNVGGAIADGGRRPDPVAAPFQVKKELSQSQTNEEGKILASSFVKAPAEKGTSHMELSKAIASESKEAADEVEQDRIPRNSQKAVKAYFDTLKNAPPQ